MVTGRFGFPRSRSLRRARSPDLAPSASFGFPPLPGFCREGPGEGGCSLRKTTPRAGAKSPTLPRAGARSPDLAHFPRPKVSRFGCCSRETFGHPRGEVGRPRPSAGQLRRRRHIVRVSRREQDDVRPPRPRPAGLVRRAHHRLARPVRRDRRRRDGAKRGRVDFRFGKSTRPLFAPRSCRQMAPRQTRRPPTEKRPHRRGPERRPPLPPNPPPGETDAGCSVMAGGGGGEGEVCLGEGRRDAKALRLKFNPILLVPKLRLGTHDRETPFRDRHACAD